MIDQTLVVDNILKELKSVGRPTSTVENDLEISSGYLWKVKKGRKYLGEEKMKLLEEYHKKYFVKIIKPTIIKNSTPKKTTEPVTVKKEVKPGSLADMMRERISETKRDVAAPYQRKKY